MKKYWGDISWKFANNKNDFKETKILNLNSDKSKKILNWQCILSIDEQFQMVAEWYKTYYSTCSKYAKLYIRKYATIVKTVAEIPATHEGGVVPVLFGSFHDLALKLNEGKIDSRYKGLEKRIGTLAIGEAHQMLSNADNKMWKNLNRVFGKNALNCLNQT